MEENMDEKILRERERYEAFEKKRFAEETIEEENKQSSPGFLWMPWP